jgi:hypothetical protein
MPFAQIYMLDGRTEEGKRNVIETHAIDHGIFMGVGAAVKWTARNEVACRNCAHLQQFDQLNTFPAKQQNRLLKIFHR